MTVEAMQTKQFELTYSRGVILVLLAGVFWSTMGLGIRNVSDANLADIGLPLHIA